MTNAVIHLLARKTTHPNMRRAYCGVVVYKGGPSSPTYTYKSGRRALATHKGAPTCERCKNAMPGKVMT